MKIKKGETMAKNLQIKRTEHSAVYFLMLCLPLMLQAQYITLPELIESVRQGHPFFAKESLNPVIELENQRSYLGTQDWVISSSPYYVYREPVSSGLGIPTKINNIGAEIAVEKVFWKTGGRFNFTWSTSYTDQIIDDIVIPMPTTDIIIPVGPSRFYENRAYVTYTQPLLQNRGGRLDQLEYDLSAYTVTMLKFQVQENQENFVLRLAELFLDWTLLIEQERIAEARLKLSQEQLDQIERKRTAYLVDKLDVLRARDAVCTAEQNIVLIQSQLKAKQAELAILAQVENIYASSPRFDLYTLDTLPDSDQAVAKIKQDAKILQALRVQHEQQQLLIAGYKDTKKPQLYLSVGAGLQSGHEDIVESFQLDKPDVLVALDFRYPLGNKKAGSDVAKARLENQRLNEEIANIELELEARVRNLLILISNMEQILALNKDQIASARERTQEEMRLYNQGRNSLTFVIQSRDNEEQAELTYAQNAAVYHQLIIQYRALMDDLFK
jgi:outer membrane protein TolC